MEDDSSNPCSHQQTTERTSSLLRRLCRKQAHSLTYQCYRRTDRTPNQSQMNVKLWKSQSRIWTSESSSSSNLTRRRSLGLFSTTSLRTWLVSTTYGSMRAFSASDLMMLGSRWSWTTVRCSSKFTNLSLRSRLLKTGHIRRYQHRCWNSLASNSEALRTHWRCMGHSSLAS